MNRKTILTTLFLGVGSLPLAAQESNQASLDPTIVQGETAPALTPVMDLDPAAIDTITSAEIQRANASDLAQTFRTTPSVTVNGGRNQGQQIFVNNLESTLLNVTIDGASQGNLFHHQSSVLIEPELIQRVDVVAGAGSALLGPGALGGAIQFETKSAFDLLDRRTVQIQDGKQVLEETQLDRFGAMFKGVGYVNGDGGKGSATIYGLLDDNWGYLLSGSYTERDSYEDGHGNLVENTDYTRESALIKLSGRFDNGQSLDLSFEHFEDETLAYDRVNIDPAWLIQSGRPTGLLQRLTSSRQTASLSYDFDPAHNDLVGVETNFFYTTQELERAISGESAEVETYGLDLRNTSIFGGFESTYGLDYQAREGKSTYAWRESGGNEEEDVFGLYLQNDVELGKYFETNFGVRFDYYEFSDISGQDFDSDHFSPNGSLTFKPIEDLSITGGYAAAYRGVGIREAFLPGVYAPGTDGEDAETIKGTVAYDNGSFFASGSVFTQSIEGYLYPAGAAGSFGDIESDGYEFKVGYRHNGFHASISMLYAEPEVDGYLYPDDFGMVRAGRHWVGDIGYTFDEVGLTVGWTLEYREDVDEISLPGPFPAVSAKDSYFLNHLYVAWQVPNIDGLTLTANFDNLFDEFYQDHTIYTGSGLASPGREVRLGVSWKF